jgi:hypothetical protein
VGGRPSGKDSSQARALISHGCGGRVEEEAGGAAEFWGWEGVGLGVVAGAAAAAVEGVWGRNGGGRGSGASGGSARSGRMACGSGIRGGDGGRRGGGPSGFWGSACAVLYGTVNLLEM